ncbi:hypothetical protein T484DRAFT_1747619 [Baffinella frigidus]|nr:hypothetical protein T484DRAFT_1747619 [Cryptophyta sp. CCMP2293]
MLDVERAALEYDWNPDTDPPPHLRRDGVGRIARSQAAGAMCGKRARDVDTDDLEFLTRHRVLADHPSPDTDDLEFLVGRLALADHPPPDNAAAYWGNTATACQVDNATKEAVAYLEATVYREAALGKLRVEQAALHLQHQQFAHDEMRRRHQKSVSDELYRRKLSHNTGMAAAARRTHTTKP